MRLKHIFPLSGYQDSSYRMTPALMRARARYQRNNTITGISVALVIGSIYYFAATAVGVDDFGDVPIPPLDEKTIEELKLEQKSIELVELERKKRLEAAMSKFK
ncbi:uncharacterized protein V1510DRAFT_420254 [Dipodascopsis tothii]|uniref:uncharacterized protein n=1 Tax=Dipodascopsis tothii TaxID=44089 RepID=UPI0034CFCD01